MGIYICIHPIYIHRYHRLLVGGFNLFEKYACQLGWWHSQYMESHKSHVPNHQPVYIYIPYISIDYISTSHLWDFYWCPHDFSSRFLAVSGVTCTWAGGAAFAVAWDEVRCDEMWRWDARARGIYIIHCIILCIYIT